MENNTGLTARDLWLCLGAISNHPKINGISLAALSFHINVAFIQICHVVNMGLRQTRSLTITETNSEHRNII